MSFSLGSELQRKQQIIKQQLQESCKKKKKHPKDLKSIFAKIAVCDKHWMIRLFTGPSVKADPDYYKRLPNGETQTNNELTDHYAMFENIPLLRGEVI